MFENNIMHHGLSVPLSLPWTLPLLCPQLTEELHFHCQGGLVSGVIDGLVKSTCTEHVINMLPNSEMLFPSD